ncbi:hypothetical protein GIB67_031724, partial [Kingdonia uniflora]
DSDGMSSFDEWEDSEGISVGSSYMLSSSGEESDTELVINPIGDVDLPSISDRFDSSDRALAVTAHRFALLRRSHKTNRQATLYQLSRSHFYFRAENFQLPEISAFLYYNGRIQHGVMINMALIVFLTVLLSFVDWCSWRIVRLPLAPFFLTRPFFISTLLASGAGYLCIPLLDSLTICQAIRKESPVMHFSKKGTPTMGGLFFIPLGIAVAKFVVGFSSFEVRAAVAATLAFAAIGLFDDISSLVKNQNSGLPAWLKVVLEVKLLFWLLNIMIFLGLCKLTASRMLEQVAVGTWFSFWLGSSTISSPYHMYTFS